MSTKQWPPGSPALIRSAAASLQAKRWEEAIHYADQALALLPDTGEFRFDVAMLYVVRAEAYFKQNKWEHARSDCEKCLALSPDVAAAHVFMGWIVKEQDHDLKKAVDYFLRAVSLEASNHYAYYGLGLCYYEVPGAKYMVAACNCMTHALKFHRAAHYFELRGKTYYILGCHEAALADYHEAHELDPKRNILFGCKHYALMHLKRYEEALRNMDEALARGVESKGIYRERAQILTYLERHEEAAAAAERAETLPEKKEPWE